MTKDDMSVIWAFVASLFMIKIVTSVMIFYIFPSWHTFLLLVLLSVIWFVVPVAYFSRNSRHRFRLLRARARRKQLLQQEWEVEEHHPQRRR